MSGATLETKDAVDPLIHTAYLTELADAYAPPPIERRDPLISPLFADLAGFPPILIQVGSAETLLADATRLAAAAGAADVDVTLQIWSHMIHAWPVWNAKLEDGRRALAFAGHFMGRISDSRAGEGLRTRASKALNFARGRPFLRVFPGIRRLPGKWRVLAPPGLWYLGTLNHVRIWSRMIEHAPGSASPIARFGGQPIAIAAAALVIVVLGISSIALWRAYTGTAPETDRAVVVRQLQARTAQASEQLVEKTKGLEATQQESIDQLQVVQDQLQTVRRLLAAQQTDTKKLSEQVGTLTEAIDGLRQSFASTRASEAAADSAPRKRSAKAKPRSTRSANRSRARRS